MSNYNKNQNGLTPVFSEYFSDENCKCQIWCAYGTKNDKATPYIFLTSSPLESLSPKDSIPIRFTLLQASNLAAALEEIARNPENYKNGYQAAQSFDQKKSLKIKVGKHNGTEAPVVALFFKNEKQERVITMSPVEALGLAKFILSDILAALIQEFSNTSAAIINSSADDSGTITFGQRRIGLDAYADVWPGFLNMNVMLVNEMRQQLPLTGENFLRLLRFAQDHGWVPTGPLDFWSSHPSLNDYLPAGREPGRGIDTKDAKEISLALRSGMKDLVSMHGDLLAYGDAPDVISAQKEPRDQMEELVKFFQRGYIVVFRWKD